MSSAELTAPTQEAPQVSRRALLGAAGAGAACVALGGCGWGEGEAPGPPVEPHVAIHRQEVQEETNLLHAGPWRYMAGAQESPGGLELSPTGLVIVNKREDNRVDPNPPLNMYGPRLQAAGDFAIGARIQGDKPVSLHLSGLPPKRFDDYRVEQPARIECETSPDGLKVRVWKGASVEPETHTFQMDNSSSDRQLEVQRQGGKLAFIADGEVLGHLPENGVFGSGQVWLGLNSEQGRAHVSSLTARPLNGHKLEVVNTPSLHVTRPLPEGLQTLVRKRGFLIGSAVSLGPLVSDPSYAQVILGGEFGSITLENAGKPHTTQPLLGEYNFGEADAIIEIAQRHGLAVHYHTPVYHKARAQWESRLSREKTPENRRYLRGLLAEMVSVPGKHFKGRVASVDVINEVLEGFGEGKVGLNKKDSVFLDVLGEECLDIAFGAAHDADPHAKRYINDNGMETNIDSRGRYMLRLVLSALRRGVPIDGLGIQGHAYELPRDEIDPRVLRELMA